MDGVQLELPFPPRKEDVYKRLYGGVVGREALLEFIRVATEAIAVQDAVRVMLPQRGSLRGRIIPDWDRVRLGRWTGGTHWPYRPFSGLRADVLITDDIGVQCADEQPRPLPPPTA